MMFTYENPVKLPGKADQHQALAWFIFYTLWYKMQANK
jgi:hypothetical protein